jgi:galactokinase
MTPAGLAGLRRQFADAFGRRPEGVWAAPGRVNLIGEHTDYNDGLVLPVALERVALAAVARRDDGLVRCLSAQLGAAPPAVLAGVSPQQRPAGWGAYPLGVAWALVRQGVDVGGFDLLVSSDVPIGAGVSSSAALGCAVALALADLAGAEAARSDLALAASRAENDIAGAPTGIMDQMAAMWAEAGHALFLDCRSLAHRPVPWAPETAGLALLVFDTSTRRALVAGAYAERRRACRRAARVLGVPALRDVSPAVVDSARGRLGDALYRRARHVVTENARVLAVVGLLDAGQPAGVGPLLSASQASLRDDFEVSCPELDTTCEAAESAGALGARMTGGGFGGCAIALVPRRLVEPVTSAARAAAERRGFPPHSVFEATAAAGARRVG